MKMVSTILVAMLVTPTGYGQVLDKEILKDAMPPLAKTLGCNKCHAIDKKQEGPAWRDVANKYRHKKRFRFADNDYLLEDGLVHKVSFGGKGHWGDPIMKTNDPNNNRQDDIRTLVRFILALPPKPRP